jgi:hypothetical protein
MSLSLFHNHNKRPDKGRRETCIQSGDNSNDDLDNVDLVWRPNLVKGRVHLFDHDGDALGCQCRAEDKDNGAEYKGDRCDPKQEHVFQTVEQGPLGTAGGGEKGTFECSHKRQVNWK